MTSTGRRSAIPSGLPWQFYLAAALGLALAVGLLFIAFTVAIFVLPVVLALVLWQRWRWQRRVRAAMQESGRPGARTVVDADYVVVDRERR